MPKKKSLTLQRVLVLLLAYIMLAVCGGVAASVLFVPGVIGANKAAKAVIPSLKVENVDFDVTSLPQKSTMYARDGSTVIATFYNQNRIVVPLKKISKTMQIPFMQENQPCSLFPHPSGNGDRFLMGELWQNGLRFRW